MNDLTGEQGEQGIPGPKGEPGDSMSPEFKRRFDEAIRSVDALYSEIAIENLKRDKRISWSRRAISICIIGIVAALGTAFFSARSAEEANNSLDAYKKATLEARVGSCEQYNVQQDLQIKAEVAQSHDLVDALASGIKDPVKRAHDVGAYNLTHDKIIRDGHPPRDCSVAGIAKYLKGAK